MVVHNFQETPYSSKRNSGSSFLRRSTDLSRQPPVVFDNPAYRRSFEFKPNRATTSFYGSWYDPDAANFEYSQANANLVAQKQNSPKGRSVSSSRLYDKQFNPNPDVVNRVNRRSLRDYVPKVLGGSSDNFNSPYGKHSKQNGSLPNGINQRSSDKRSLPRTDIESSDLNYSADPYPRFKPSYRSRSFEPDLRPEPINRPEVNFSTIDNRRGKRYSKHSTRNIERKREKQMKSKSQREYGNGAHVDRIHRSNSTGRALPSSTYPEEYPSNRILSSNLYPGTYVMPRDPRDNARGVFNNRRRERSPSQEDKRNNVCAVKYRPINNSLLMYQTKL